MVRKLTIGVVALAALAVAGCSKSPEVDELGFTEKPAEELYNEGLALANDGRLDAASKKFKEIDQVYPYSEFARRAMIMSAYTNYRSGQFSETINSAKRYITLYPGSEDAAYAQYLIGQSYYRQVLDVSRDQEMSEKALQAMAELVQRFPDSEYVEDATNKIRITSDQLAGKEMQVGRYYLHRRRYVAAINRFKTVVTQYQTTRHTEEALARLTEGYLSLGVVDEAQTAAAVLGHNYPESKWYKDAFSLLESGGFEPKENKKSWISRQFSKVKVL
ncbi:MAG: outer membrane protein assembly factor BamD [Pseudomonadota bacterium]